MAIRTIQTRRRKVDEALAWSGTAVAAATVLGLGAVAVLGTAVQQVVLQPDPPPRVVADGGVFDRVSAAAEARPVPVPGAVDVLPGVVLLPADEALDDGPRTAPTAPSPAPDPVGPGAGPGPGQGNPGPGPRPQEGPVSSLVDPAVEGVTGTVDDVTGSVTEPVTDPVRGVVDDLTDTVDGILGGGRGSDGRGLQQQGAQAQQAQQRKDDRRRGLVRGVTAGVGSAVGGLLGGAGGLLGR